jgi:hypothetical protein
MTMTVAELIEELREMPQDAEIWIDRDSLGSDLARSVELYDDSPPPTVVISCD